MGLAAAGTAALQLTCAAQVLSPNGPKVWNVSASLSGFYDDNYNTGPDTSKKGSFGLEFSPSFSATVPLTQTEIGAQYTYDVQYYEERDHLNQNPYDQSHSLNLWIDHSFNEEWQAKASDAFVSGQEPELLGSGGAPFRIEGNNIVNNMSAELDTEWTREISTTLTYGNTLVDYDNQQYSAWLNRDQNSIALDGKYHFDPETMVFVGYSFGLVNYTGDQVIGLDPLNGVTYVSASRDNYSHYGYVGFQRNLTANLVAAVKAGVQYNDQYNNPVSKTTSLSPYADVSLIYSYLPGCNAQVGFTQTRNATYQTAVSTVNGSLTEDQESSTLHASINHRVTEKLMVTAIGVWSAGTYQQGAYADETDTTYSLGLSANYAFTRNFSGNINYNYDNLSSEVPGTSYSRNRVSIGVTVAY